MKKILLAIVTSCISFASLSADLVVDGKIAKIGSTNSNVDTFFVVIEGGNGPCANLTIDFPAALAQSTEAFRREFSLATTAFVSGKKVRIYSYEGNECTKANFISIYN